MGRRSEASAGSSGRSTRPGRAINKSGTDCGAGTDRGAGVVVGEDCHGARTEDRNVSADDVGQRQFVAQMAARVAGRPEVGGGRAGAIAGDGAGDGWEPAANLAGVEVDGEIV
jgi:hypothetical protein